MKVLGLFLDVVPDRSLLYATYSSPPASLSSGDAKPLRYEEEELLCSNGVDQIILTALNSLLLRLHSALRATRRDLNYRLKVRPEGDTNSYYS